jgi:hypothetical protein
MTTQELVKKLKSLKRRDDGYKVFGASTHRYTLNQSLRAFIQHFIKRRRSE